MIETAHCFFQLVGRELKLFFQDFFNRFLDISLVLITWVIVFGYLMEQSGLDSSYGVFVLVGLLSSFGLFETLWRATLLAQDMSDKKLSNFLVLPLPSWLVFVSIAFSWALSTGILTLCLFPVGKLLLWKSFHLSEIAPMRFCLMFVLSNLFYGVFALWIASLVTSLRNSSWLWTRVVNPLYMFCGFFYTWQSVYELSPWIGYLHLVNPLLYILEGTKACMLGQAGYLPFGICVFVIIVWIIFCLVDAIRRCKRRLEFV